MALVDIATLAGEFGLDASYRGIPFTMLDSRDAGGRRVVAFLFPGTDLQVYHDLGQAEGDIVVNGIIVGDDYAQQATRLRHAFRIPAPATLSHPWLGDITVVQAPSRPPEFQFDHQRLRVVTFTATFRRFGPLRPALMDTLTALFNVLTDLRAAARSLLRQVLAPVRLVMGAVSQVTRLASEAATVFSRAIVAVRDPAVGIAGALPIGLLKGIAGIPLDDGYPDAVAARFAGPAAAIAGTSAPVVPAAVAPGGTTTRPVPVDARVTVTVILTVVNALAMAPADPLARRQIALCAQVLMLAEAIQAAAGIAFDSQPDAIAWRDRIAAALDDAATRAAALVSAQPAEAATLWRSLTATRAAWLADMTETIGRLPAVRRITPPAQVPLWVWAHHLAGDDPSRVLDVWHDLVRRNDVRHPALPPPGPLETLA